MPGVSGIAIGTVRRRMSSRGVMVAWQKIHAGIIHVAATVICEDKQFRW